MKGAQEIMSLAEVRAFVAEITGDGRALSSENMVEKLKEKMEEKIKTRGLSTIGSRTTPSIKTVKNYMALALSGPETRPVKSTVSKSDSRWTAERSLISAMSFALVVGATHFIPCAPCVESEKLLRECKLACMVSEALGGISVT